MIKTIPIPLLTGTWLCLFFLFLPFPTEIVPEIGTQLTKLFLPVTRALSTTNNDILSDTYSFSDSIHIYFQTALLGIIALGLTWLLSRKNKVENLIPWLRSILACILAFFLLKYGLEKWTHLQFPTPPPNILHSDTGSLDKDILFWSLMGTSNVYSGFMGFVEVLAGTLLFFRRTRMIGGYLALGVFANVFALNLGFDVTVKLLSFALLITSLYIISPTIQPIYTLLASKNAVSMEVPEINLSPFLKRLLKGLAITLIVLECVLPIFDRNSNPPSNQSLNHQTFEIIATQRLPDTIQDDNYKHLHFHPQGFLITETFEGEFESYPIQLPEGANQFKFEGSKKTIKAIKNGDEWLFTEKNQLLWRCRRVKNESLPLLQDNFHWTVEGMLSN